jgi:ubiquinone/menaquinone biosynthesis C-methylase UbiE
VEAVREDFDRIVLLSDDSWNHNTHYHRFLLKQVPANCGACLDLGCGTGAFSRLLAERCEWVLGLDLSPQAIQLARERSSGFHNVDFQVADATTWDFPTECFDCIASIATLHHLPIPETLQRMARALRVGGTLLILDLFQATGVSELLTNLAAVPVNLVLGLLKNGRLREPRAVREAWAEHGWHDTYPSLDEMRRICRDVLPGAQIKRHLLWRYSLVWRKMG